MSSSTYSDPEFNKRPLKPLRPAVQIITRLVMKELSLEEKLQLSKTLEIAAMEERATKQMEDDNQT